jgi:hypothetical protein
LLLAGLPLLAVGCGAGELGAGSANTTLKLRPAQAGGTFTVRVGQRIELALTATRTVPGASTTWTADSSNREAVLRTGIYEKPPTAFVNVTYPVVIDFRAETAGRADIVARSEPTCEALPPPYCHGPPAMTFHIHVVDA